MESGRWPPDDRVKVLNIHERLLPASPTEVGALLDSLASPGDLLWPKDTWPTMRFERALGLGAKGGHGPIRYSVAEYRPGERIRFRFEVPRGFHGGHGYEVVSKEKRTLLRQTLEMEARGPALLTWPLVFRPLHDALIEDSLVTAQVTLGMAPEIRPWSRWVRLLRWAVSSGKARPQRGMGTG